MRIREAVDMLCQALAEVHASRDLRFTFPPKAWDALERELARHHRFAPIETANATGTEGAKITYYSEIGTVVITKDGAP